MNSVVPRIKETIVFKDVVYEVMEVVYYYQTITHPSICSGLGYRKSYTTNNIKHINVIIEKKA